VEEFNDKPFSQFIDWYNEQRQYSLKVNIRGLSPDFFTLSTVDDNGPSARTLVLREKTEDEGFIFITNKNSRKGRLLGDHPESVCLFCWHSDTYIRQIRITGSLSQTSEERRHQLFYSLPISWQLGYHAIKEQGKPLEEEDEEKIKQRFDHLQSELQDKKVPVPDNYIACAVKPIEFEFYQSGDTLVSNERILYTIDNNHNNQWQKNQNYSINYIILEYLINFSVPLVQLTLVLKYKYNKCDLLFIK